MSSNPKIADDFVAIAKAVKELEAERWKQLQETKLPEVGVAAVGWPQDIDYVCWGASTFNLPEGSL